MRLLLLVILCVRAVAIDLASLPDGYPEQKLDVPEGAFDSVLSDPAADILRRLNVLESKVYGLAKLGNEDEVKQAEIVFYLENVHLGLHQIIANETTSDLTDFERRALHFRSMRVYEGIRHHAERLYELMIREVSARLPGSTGSQLREDLLGVLDPNYDPNHRMDVPLTLEQSQVKYQEKLKVFQERGGKLEEMFILTDTTLEELPVYTRAEYVVRENGQIWITEGDAGHVLLAAGQSVSAAGQMVILKDRHGRVDMLVVSNSSGNYKPDIYSAERLKHRLSDDFGIPLEKILVTKGEPVSPQIVKVLLKARGVDADEAKAALQRVELNAQRLRASSWEWLHRPVAPDSCNNLAFKLTQK